MGHEKYSLLDNPRNTYFVIQALLFVIIEKTGFAILR